ncbi:protein translocase subunit SecD [Thermomicrobiaceae bacterium CFH 74404]|uniref:Protein translocase subunit SecD n=1 Tax=Thermalbibacter longus TaxID=2951981 RepID=A0AA41WA52_9BACT|nr:protein translocase subunit SecD [Thermalbibacter longus]MCM8748316.1 protein translocase subunit SecD [Thermalbibacter longus]
MRIKPWQTLIAILLLTLAAVWVDLPGQTLDPFGWKSGITVQQGLDLQGGIQIVLEARPPAGVEVTQDVLQGTRDTIERRVNGLGVSEPVIQTRGSNQILVELPGYRDPEQAVRVLQRTALLEIIDTNGQYLAPGTIVNTTAGPASDVLGNEPTPTAEPAATPQATASPATATATPSPGATPGVESTPAAGEPAGTTASPTPEAGATPTPDATSEAEGPVYETIITGADLQDAYPTTDQFGTLVVGFELKGEATRKFCDYTSSHVGFPMSIVVDKQVISSPQIESAICEGRGIISGLNAQEVNELVLQLKSGALAVPLEVVQSRTVGPTLGQDSIDKSIVAGLVGLGLVALFMILYYRLPGIISVIALLMYTSFVFALFKLIPVVLTLPGIAGFILSIGMAVDANVLIFARLKEELRRGRTIARAIEEGFEHAWPSIRDSNISTMITCAILFWFGRYVGATIIQGFALTLFIGVAVSMFTAIVVSRNLLRVLLTSGLFHNLWWFGLERRPAEPAPAPGD